MGHPGQPRSLSGEESNSGCTLQAEGCQTQSRCTCSTTDGKRAVPVKEAAATGGLSPAGCIVTPMGAREARKLKLTRLLFAFLLPGVATCVGKYF